MHFTKKVFFALAVCFIGSSNLYSQSSPDCVTAPNMCGNSTINFVSSSGSGSFVDYSTSTTISNPQSSPAGIVPPGGSGCHLAGELNPNFFIITCQTPGTLEFSIADGPGVQMGCYDWIMWPYTATTCSGISGNTLPPTRCCWNAACSGGTGIASSANLPSGASANNYCTPVNVNCGDKFIICISNYSGVNATVPVKFIGTSVVSCAATTGTPLAVNNATICSGGTATLIITGGAAATTATWTPGPTVTNTLIVSPSTTTTYTATKPAGCGTGTITATVSVVPTPTAAANNNSPVCAGASFTLFGTGVGTYSWSGPGGYSSTLQNPVLTNATTAMSGVYTLTVSNGNCKSVATTSVTVNPNPVPVAANTGPYCPGNTIQLSVGAASSYTWSGPAFSSNAQNPTIANATTAMSGIYTVTVANAQGCKGTATTNVVVNPNPVVNVNSNNPVCINGNINLTSTGGGTYSWSGPNAFTSTNQNPTIANVNTVNSGVYSVTVTTLGCTATGSVNVVVTTPTVTAANPGPFCAGTTMSLTSTAASTFTWTGPGGFTSSSQNPTQSNVTVGATGTYTVIVAIGTCTASSTTNVVVNALPTPSAQSNSPICAGQTLNLIGSGGTTYTWTGPSFTSNSSSPSIPNANTSNSGNYVLTVTDGNGCTNTTSTPVTVNPLPVIAVTNPTNCVNTTINLTSNGGVTYSWSGPNSFSSNQQNPTIPLAQTNMSGVYVVTVTDANGCINTANANVTVLPLPNPNIVGNSPVCAGGVLNLQGSGGANYSWSGPGYTGPAQNPTINNVSTAASGVYTLLVTSGTCTASTTYTVVINPLPVFNFSNNNVLCNSQSNGTSTINVSVGTGPYSYQWSNGQTTQVATGLNAGTYSCIVTDANNCSSMASTSISQPNAFTVTINSATNSACANSPINVSANGSGGTMPYTYTWTSGPNASAYSINETAAGNYVYTVNATDGNGCVSTSNINLTFFPQPTVTATSATVCAGTATAITASGATNYIWQPGNVSGPTYPFSGNTSVNVTVVGTSNGCSNSANASIVVSPIPSANFTTSGDKACVPACVTFNGSGSANIIAYGWTLNGVGVGNGNANETYCFDQAATYSVGLTVIDNNGCTSTSPPISIDIYPQPVADFNHAPIKPIVNIDQEVTFTDASWGTPIASWNWYFMNTAQYTSTLQNPTFSYTEPGTYAVALVVKSDKGCMDTLIRAIEVGEDFGIYVPNAFTPNGDGLNDIFQPKGFGITKYELFIYDRWGELMFHTNTFEEGWNGAKQKKKDVSYPLIIEEGVYTWLINCTSVFGKSHELKGHVTLIK